MIEQLGKLIPQPQPAETPRDPHWNNLKIKVSKGSEDGPAAVGFVLKVLKQPGIGENVHNGRGTAMRTIDQTGIADCGYVEPGVYDAVVTTAWNEATTVTFTVHPGKDHLETLVAPGEMPIASTSLTVEGTPDDDENMSLAMLIRFHQTGTRNFAGHEWKPGEMNSMFSKALPCVLFIPKHGLWVAEVSKEDFGVFTPKIAQTAKWDVLDSTHKFEIPASQYSVDFSFVFLTNGKPSRNHFGTIPDSVSPHDPQWRKSVTLDKYVPLDTCPGFHLAALQFVAEAGKPNRWTISVPEEVVEKFRVCGREIAQ